MVREKIFAECHSRWVGASHRRLPLMPLERLNESKFPERSSLIMLFAFAVLVANTRH